MSSEGARANARDALLDAAAVLMDERGIDEVSLNEINRAAGQLNRSAVQYHFGTRDALVVELFERTMQTVDLQRNALLDHLEATHGTLSEREAVEVITGPLVGQLQTIEGRRYLRLCGQLLNHPRYNSDVRETLGMTRSLHRSVPYARPAVDHLPAPIIDERGSQIIAFLVRAIADQARLIDSNPPPRPVLGNADFQTNLVDVIMGMFSAPTSVQPARTSGRSTSPLSR